MEQAKVIILLTCDNRSCANYNKIQAGEDVGFKAVYSCLEGLGVCKNRVSKCIQFSTNSEDTKKLINLPISNLNYQDMP